jgi:hypothetical protein
MKRDDIRKETEAHLTAIGFKRGQWQWQPQLAQLLLLINGDFKIIKLRSGMSRRALVYQHGYIAGLAESAGIQPAPKAKKLNGATPHVENEIPA